MQAIMAVDTNYTIALWILPTSIRQNLANFLEKPTNSIQKSSATSTPRNEDGTPKEDHKSWKLHPIQGWTHDKSRSRLEIYGTCDQGFAAFTHLIDSHFKFKLLKSVVFTFN